MTPPSDLQAEIARLAAVYRHETGTAAQMVESLLMTLAAFCYRDAAKECRALGKEHPQTTTASIREVSRWCADAIARRAKEMT